LDRAENVTKQWSLRTPHTKKKNVKQQLLKLIMEVQIVGSSYCGNYRNRQKPIAAAVTAANQEIKICFKIRQLEKLPK